MSTPSTDRSAPSPSEIRQMLLDPVAAERITQGVEEPIDAVFINSLHFLTRTIKRLEAEVDRQEREFEHVFNYASGSRSFRQHLTPILRDFRRRSRNPYPPTTSSPSLRSDRTSEESLPVLFPVIDLPQTVEIHSPNPNNDTTSTSPHTANVELGGSEFNPIDVDLIPDHLMGLNSGLRRSRSAPHPSILQNVYVLRAYCKNLHLVRTDCVSILHGNRAWEERLSKSSTRSSDVYPKHEILHVLWTRRTHSLPMCSSPPPPTPAVNHRKSISPQSTHIPLFV